MFKPRSAGRVRQSYKFTRAHIIRYRVKATCAALGVAPSGYYGWLRSLLSNRAWEYARLLRLIRATFTRARGSHGLLASSWTSP